MGNRRDILEIQAWADGETSPERSRDLEASDDARRVANSIRQLHAMINQAESRESHPIPLAADLKAIKRSVLQSESVARQAGLHAQSLADGALEGASEALPPETLRHVERIRALSKLIRENPPAFETPVASDFYLAGIRDAVEAPKTIRPRIASPLRGWLKWARAPQFASALASFVTLLLVAGQLHRSEPLETSEEMEIIYVAGASDSGMQPVFWVDDHPRREGAVY